MDKRKKSMSLLACMLFLFTINTLLTSNLTMMDSATSNGEDIQENQTLKDAAGEITIVTPENTTYYGPMEGYYPGTFGFEKDEINSYPSGWIIECEANDISVVDEVDGHKNVLQMYDTDSSASGCPSHTKLYTIFDDRTSGTIEFWHRVDDYWGAYTFDLYEGSTEILNVRIGSGGQFRYYDGSSYYYGGTYINEDQWYHMRIDFDTTDWHLWVNGTLQEFEGTTNLGLINSPTTGVNKLELFLDNYDNSDMNNWWIDAMGFSWDPNYSVGDNLNEGLLLSYNNNTNLDWQGYSLYPDPNYEATYSFEDDNSGTQPDGFTFDVTTGDIQVIDSLDGHNKVVEYYVPTGFTGLNLMKPDAFISNRMDNVEFWYYSKSTEDGNILHVYGDEGWEYGFAVQVNSTNLVINNFTGASSKYKICPFSPNHWYHIRVGWDTAAGEFNISVNQEFEGTFPFYYTPSEIDGVAFASRHREGYSYFDAIGLQSMGYEVGTNINFEVINSTIYGNTTIPMPEDGTHSVKVFGNNTSGTMYESEVRYFTVQEQSVINLVTPENKTYYGSMEGYYPGTWGFENVKNGDKPERFILDEVVGSIDVISDFNGHEKVLSLVDSSTSNYVEALIEFGEEKTYGTVETWMASNDATNGILFELKNDVGADNRVARILIEDDVFSYSDDTGWHDLPITTYDNEWYHVRVDFENTTGGYCDLEEGRYKITINGIDYGNYSFQHNYAPDHIRLGTEHLTSVTGYYDGIACSWDPEYEIGDNLNEGLILSYNNNTNLDWQGYSLDGAQNRTIYGNTTIPLPSEGAHSIQIFANDTSGNVFSSESRYFTIETIDITGYHPLMTGGTSFMINQYGVWISYECNSPGYFKAERKEDHEQSRILGSELRSHYYYEFSTYTISGNQLVKSDSILNSATIRLYYNEVDIENEDELTVLHLVEQGNGVMVWKKLECSINSDNNYVEFTTTEFSYFCLAELDTTDTAEDTGFWIFFMDNLFMIVILAAVGITIPSAYAIRSKRKKQAKDQQGSEVDEEKVKEIMQKAMRKRERMLHYENDEKLAKKTELKSKSVKKKKQIAPKAKKKATQKIAFSESNVDKAKRLQEIKSTEKEVSITEKYDKCAVHKGRITGLSTTFDNQMSGTIEFWHRADQDNNKNWLALYDGIDRILYVTLGSNPWRYLENGFWHYSDETHYANQWYHIKIEFDSTDWHFYVNGTLKEFDGTTDLTLDNVPSNGVNKLTLFLDNYLAATREWWIDGMGFSWDPNYEIGDNLKEGLLLDYESTISFDWQGYSLDGGENKTISGDTIIPMPSEGLHSIQIFANDSSGTVFSSEKRYFNINIVDVTGYHPLMTGGSPFTISQYGIWISYDCNAPGYFKAERNEDHEQSIILGSELRSHYYYSFNTYTISGNQLVESHSIINSATIRLLYNEESIENEEELTVLHLVEQGDGVMVWKKLDCNINTENNYIEFTTTEFSYFCLAELTTTDTAEDAGFWIFFMDNLFMIVILAAVGISIPSAYAIRSKRKKKASSQQNSDIDEEKVKEIMQKAKRKRERLLNLDEDKKLAKKTDLKVNSAKSIKEKKLTPNNVKKKKTPSKKFTFSESEVDKVKRLQEIEKTEKEVSISDKYDKCPVHKGRITGISYVCPKCSTRYCLKCAQTLQTNDEGCWMCDTKISINIPGLNTTNMQGGEKSGNQEDILSEFDNTVVIEKLEGMNGEEVFETLKDVSLTTVSEEFLTKLKLLDMDVDQKREFIKEMVNLLPKERHEIIDYLLEKQNERKK